MGLQQSVQITSSGPVWIIPQPVIANFHPDRIFVHIRCKRSNVDYDVTEIKWGPVSGGMLKTQPQYTTVHHVFCSCTLLWPTLRETSSTMRRPNVGIRNIPCSALQRTTYYSVLLHFFCFLNEMSTTRSSAPTPFSVRHRILPAMGLRSRSSRSPMISSCRGWPCGWHPPEPECRPGSGGTHPQKTLQSQDLLVNVFLTMTASFLSQVLIALFHAVVKQLLVRPDRWYLITEHFSIHAGPDFKA